MATVLVFSQTDYCSYLEEMWNGGRMQSRVSEFMGKLKKPSPLTCEHSDYGDTQVSLPGSLHVKRSEDSAFTRGMFINVDLED